MSIAVDGTENAQCFAVKLWQVGHSRQIKMMSEDSIDLWC
jgi:hypothetical protein